MWIGAEAADLPLLMQVRDHVAAVFERPVRMLTTRDRPADSLDPRRGQHSSTRILQWLAPRKPEGVSRVLAITDGDLFIPILTFVYGEAQLDGPAAVVSVARLGDSAALVAGSARLAARLEKEAVHELGHTFGLVHCGDPLCVMSRSASLAEVDQKRRGLCLDCRARLAEGGGS